MLAKSRFEIFFPADQRAKFVKALEGDKGLIMNVCARMDINKATAYDKDDEVRILKQVDDSGIGRRGLVSEGGRGSDAAFASHWAPPLTRHLPRSQLGQGLVDVGMAKPFLLISGDEITKSWK